MRASTTAVRNTRGNRLSRWTLTLLVAAVGLAGVLAYQAYAVARTHRQVVDETLTDFAAVGAWKISGLVELDVIQGIYMSAMPGITLFGRDGHTPDPTILASRLQRTQAVCGCVQNAPVVFTWAAGGGWRFHAEPGSDDLQSWVRQAVPAHAGRTQLPVFEPPRMLTDRSGSIRHPVDWAAHAYGMVLDASLDVPGIAMYVVERDSAGGIVGLFGIASPPEPFLRALLHRPLKVASVLPAAIVRGVDVDSLVVVRVRDEANQVAAMLGNDVASPFAASEMLPPQLGAMALEVALDPRLAERLVPGGVPRSRLPELLGTLALLVGTVVIMALQLRRQAELSELRTGFVAGVSHELRTPLAQIRALAEFLQMERPVSPGQMRRSLRIIDQEARRLSFLVDNVLAYGRAERRDVQVAPEPLPLAPAIAELLELFSPLASADRVTVYTAVPEGLVVYVDPSALRQVLINLLDNAVRYGPSGQAIRISAAEEGGDVLITVEDEGPGVPDAERERVFEPYVRLDRDRRAARGGSGIGLSVVREIVKAHGGSVWIAPSSSGGTCVVIRLASGGSLDGEEADGAEAAGRAHERAAQPEGAS